MSFLSRFFGWKKLITSLKSTGKILFINFIPPYSTYWIHKSSYLLRQNFEFVVLQYICLTAVELMRIEKGFVPKILILLLTTKLLFLLDYLVQIHILLRFRDNKGKLKPRSTSFESFMKAQNLDLGRNFKIVESSVSRVL